MSTSSLPWWTWAWPVLAFTSLIVTAIFGATGVIAAIAGVILIAAVFAAVYHAEVLAHRIGEPFGTLVLALAVTIIEVALIVSIMVGVSADKAGLARDTVFAVVMIVCNGIVGLCLLWGGMRHHEQGFQVQGASAALAVLAPLTILTMILPKLHVANARPCFQHVAACLCLDCFPRALLLLRLCSNSASSRLLSATREY
jgi:Ca2+:H+ antiporter